MTSYSTLTSSAAASACSRVSASTRQSGSPVKRTRSKQKTGWSGTVRPCAFSPGTSAAVRTLWTPGASSALLVSSETMRAYACSDQTTLPWSIPSIVRSSAKGSFPCTLSCPSSRTAEVPIGPYFGSHSS